MKTNMKRKVASVLTALTLMTVGATAMISSACAEGVATRWLLDHVDPSAVVESIDQDVPVNDHVSLVRPYINHRD